MHALYIQIRGKDTMQVILDGHAGPFYVDCDNLPPYQVFITINLKFDRNILMDGSVGVDHSQLYTTSTGTLVTREETLTHPSKCMINIRYYQSLDNYVRSSLTLKMMGKESSIVITGRLGNLKDSSPLLYRPVENVFRDLTTNPPPTPKIPARSTDQRWAARESSVVVPSLSKEDSEDSIMHESNPSEGRESVVLILDDRNSSSALEGFLGRDRKLRARWAKMCSLYFLYGVIQEHTEEWDYDRDMVEFPLEVILCRHTAGDEAISRVRRIIGHPVLVPPRPPLADSSDTIMKEKNEQQQVTKSVIVFSPDSVFIPQYKTRLDARHENAMIDLPDAAEIFSDIGKRVETILGTATQIEMDKAAIEGISLVEKSFTDSAFGYRSAVAGLELAFKPLIPHLRKVAARRVSGIPAVFVNGSEAETIRLDLHHCALKCLHARYPYDQSRHHYGNLDFMNSFMDILFNMYFSVNSVWVRFINDEYIMKFITETNYLDGYNERERQLEGQPPLRITSNPEYMNPLEVEKCCQNFDRIPGKFIPYLERGKIYHLFDQSLYENTTVLTAIAQRSPRLWLSTTSTRYMRPLLDKTPMSNFSLQKKRPISIPDKYQVKNIDPVSMNLYVKIFPLRGRNFTFSMEEEQLQDPLTCQRVITWANSRERLAPHLDHAMRKVGRYTEKTYREKLASNEMWCHVVYQAYMALRMPLTDDMYILLRAIVDELPFMASYLHLTVVPLCGMFDFLYFDTELLLMESVDPSYLNSSEFIKLITREKPISPYNNLSRSMIPLIMQKQYLNLFSIENRLELIRKRPLSLHGDDTLHHCDIITLREYHCSVLASEHSSESSSGVSYITEEIERIEQAYMKIIRQEAHSRIAGTFKESKQIVSSMILGRFDKKKRSFVSSLATSSSDSLWAEIRYKPTREDVPERERYVDEHFPAFRSNKANELKELTERYPVIFNNFRNRTDSTVRLDYGGLMVETGYSRLIGMWTVTEGPQPPKPIGQSTDRLSPTICPNPRQLLNVEIIKKLLDIRSILERRVRNIYENDGLYLPESLFIL